MGFQNDLGKNMTKPAGAIIDFDDSTTFPPSLAEFSQEFKEFLFQKIDPHRIIEHQLHDLHICEMPIVQDFLAANKDTEIAVCHCTRILNQKSYWDSGIVINGGRNSPEEMRIRNLLQLCGFSNDQIQEIVPHLHYYWDRDGLQRTASVHFFADKSQMYRDDKINYFAINLGGEILQRAICGLGEKKYREEPYKRLWIMGTPCVVKFKCKLKNVCAHRRNILISEIVNYNIATKLFGSQYEIDVTGSTIGSVPPEDILSIEEIPNFIEMQEKYDEYVGFYDEIKHK